jgi:ribulose bisphosphate carboxylase small subunit
VGKVTGDFTAKLEPVQWYWKRWGSMSQWPTVFQKEKKLEFMWADHTNKYLTTVTFTLRKKGKLVELEIHESGWKQAHLKNAFANCEGWTTFLAYLKAYVTKGIDLRHEKS